MKRTKVLKGYHHSYSEESIKQYMALPTEMKLKWLEEVNRFSYCALPPKNKKIRELLRAGKI